MNDLVQRQCPFVHFSSTPVLFDTYREFMGHLRAEHSPPECQVSRGGRDSVPVKPPLQEEREINRLSDDEIILRADTIIMEAEVEAALADAVARGLVGGLGEGPDAWTH